ncbi:MAG: hypothetical protein IJK87_05190 [Prevotella sp.]|nr:hypothetical protein [Prevotella sp.]
MKIENELWPSDIKLFTEMEGHYQSENERIFFEQMYRKMQSEYTMNYDGCELLIVESENEEGVFLFRLEYDEFIFGIDKGESSPEIVHTMGLRELLDINMFDNGFSPRNLTIWNWLRERDYKDITYNRYG